MTVVPAIVAVLLFVTAGAMSLLPGDIERRLSRSAAGSGRFSKLLSHGVAVPALAATGVRILTTMLHELRRRNVRYGLETMCVGSGQGLAAIFEAV